MLTFEDLRNYFDKFLIPYAPYRESKIYNTIINKILKTYFDDSYNQIPSIFKSTFEEQKIPIELYNIILLSVGFTEDILNKISYKDKEILLKSYTDFNIFKGTLNQIREVCSDFEEELNLYELLIDFRTIFISYYFINFLKNKDYVIVENEFIYNSIKINDHIQIPGDPNSYRVVTKKEDFKIYIDKPFDFDTIIALIVGNPNVLEVTDDNIKIKNVNIDRWVFVPDLIYSGEKVKDKVIKHFLDYDKIYDGTKRYFVSIDNLEKNKESLLLPIKSNLIFLDYKKFREINLINYLFATIILKEYRSSRLIIYFKDGNYLTNLERIYKLWYYIIFKFYNNGISTNGLPNPALIFSLESPYFNLKVEDIDNILVEYNSITTAHQASLFYNKYFTNNFYPLTNRKIDLSLEEFKILIENDIGKDLLEYVENRILNAKGIDSEFECSFILDELYYSILTWVYDNPILKEKIKYFLDSLSYISTSIQFSPTYNLILFLKPYHVELVKELDEILSINNRFNLVNPDHRKKIFITLFKASVLTISHNILKSKIIFDPVDNIIIISNGQFILKVLAKDILNIFDKFFQFILYSEESVQFQNHKDLFYIKKQIYSIVFIIVEKLIKIIKNDYENVEILHKFNSLITIHNESIQSIFNLTNSDIKQLSITSTPIIIESILNFNLINNNIKQMISTNVHNNHVFNLIST